MKPQTAWAIVEPEGTFWIYGFRRDKETSKMSIRLATNIPWPELERRGFRCVAVEIRVIEQEGEG